MKLKVRKEMLAMRIKNQKWVVDPVLQLFTSRDASATKKTGCPLFVVGRIWRRRIQRQGNGAIVQLGTQCTRSFFYFKQLFVFYIRCTSRAIVANPRRWTGRDSNSDRARTLIKWANFVSRKQGARKYSALGKNWSNKKFTRTQLSIKLSLFVVQIWYRHWSNLN